MAPYRFATILSVLCALLPASTYGAAISKRQSAISTSQIGSYKPFTFFASAAYCQPSATLAWNCGANCDANSGFQPVASGGDGESTQFWYVGWDPAQATVIVAHEGTDPSDFLSDLVDAQFELVNLDSTLFPGIDSSIKVHDGFAGSQSRSAPDVLSAVQTALNAYGSKSVTIVGHSLGMRLNLGLQVGNQAFADYVDANVHLTHINNEEDPIPIVPGKFLGYVHPVGEIHIQDSGSWEACPGQDNPSTLCIVGDVPEVFDGSLSNHDGPYDGITMGC
ncbi:hypothetical protein EWM64_g2823 [Hericium alpestre]|uniref:Fungal lipase-type domain-containing protein n=1 Tax=Hericium alpestre TaxID=135208 RepID=A0A4Z0A6A2_9AGAM|nr:hypothetical protein EWM64_g2823 [Hericium alpestre]